MQLTCPSCHTAFHVDRADLRAEGRHVRCARCRTTWFARSSDAVSVPSGAEVLTEGAVRRAATGAARLPQIVPWNDTVMVEINPSPSLAPAFADNIAAPPVQISRPARPAGLPTAAARQPRRAKHDRPAKRLVAIAVMIAAILLAAVSYRATVVRFAPGLAELYAAVGLPVNLRGLEFQAIKTSRETQDGVPVLVIEGEIVNVTRQAVELPRLRFAVMGEGDRELYVWTALLPRAVLPEGESVPFRSRLASPPSEGKEVLVRFLNRLDLTASRN